MLPECFTPVDNSILEVLEKKAAMFDWLMSQMRGSGLHIDGTDVWSLPLNVLSRYRTRKPDEACRAAYAQYQSWVANNRPTPTEPLLGAQDG